MSEACVLAAEALTKIYSDGRHNITVLNQLQLEIASGEWLAVVGASGAGKSTLLNCLGGLDLPTSGVVKVAGRALPSLSESERSQWRNQHLGFIFQMHHLLPEFTALEGVAMPARIGGLSRKAAQSRAQKLLERWVWVIVCSTAPRHCREAKGREWRLRERWLTNPPAY